MRSYADKFCDECDGEAVEQYANGEPVGEILAWYPASLTALREAASQRRKRRGTPCPACGKLQPRGRVCDKCRNLILVYAAQHGTAKAATGYHLSKTAVQNFGREFLD